MMSLFTSYIYFSFKDKFLHSTVFRKITLSFVFAKNRAC